MARIYANSCEKGLKNFNQVPKKLQPQVKALIEADGYIILDDGTVTRPDGYNEVEEVTE